MESCSRRFSWCNRGIISRGISRVRIPDHRVPTYLPIRRHNPFPRFSRRFAHRDVKSFARIFSATATLSFSFPSPLHPPLLRKIRHADFSHPVSPVWHRRWLTFRREISSPWLSVPGSSQRYYTPIVIIVVTTHFFFLPDFFLHSPHLIRFRNRAIAKCLACARFGVPFPRVQTGNIAWRRDITYINETYRYHIKHDFFVLIGTQIMPHYTARSEL